ncbi:ATP-binding protein [Streptomyces sp. 549]|uniref:ATP-binding protein n=1 Tax=Streptomyces sp. 549 TaxID=3049076 RepID=UPI0024C27C41|nr:ATP-binding protein [Streptomyces sp. 549]MDK1473006.1 ATP-binding protein [Streptomyces sp. 549]
MIITYPLPGTESDDAVRLRRDTAVNGTSESGAHARRFTADFLHDVDESGVFVPPRSLEDVQLVVSELVTNAVKYAGGPALLTLSVDPVESTIQVTVWDASPVAPVLLPPDAARVGGHGLEIVHALSLSVHVESGPGGKYIHATMPV